MEVVETKAAETESTPNNNNSKTELPTNTQTNNNNNDNNQEQSNENKSESTGQKEDMEIPKANLQRLVKQILPEGVQIAKEAKSALPKATKIFLLYLASCANDICAAEHKTKITPDHVFKALELLEFDFEKELRESFDNWKKAENEKKENRDLKKRKTEKDDKE